MARVRLPSCMAKVRSTDRVRAGDAKMVGLGKI